MSRVGKKPVQLPDGIEADIVANQITIKGQKGQLNQTFPESVKLEKEDDKILISPLNATKNAKAAWGMTRTIINNMVLGVSTGFNRNLEINGVGYRASKEANILTYRDKSFSSPVTGSVGPSHHTTWLEAMDDSMKTYLANK